MCWAYKESRQSYCSRNNNAIVDYYKQRATSKCNVSRRCCNVCNKPPKEIIHTIPTGSRSEELGRRSKNALGRDKKGDKGGKSGKNGKSKKGGSKKGGSKKGGSKKGGSKKDGSKKGGSKKGSAKNGKGKKGKSENDHDEDDDDGNGKNGKSKNEKSKKGDGKTENEDSQLNKNKGLNDSNIIQNDKNGGLDDNSKDTGRRKCTPYKPRASCNPKCTKYEPFPKNLRYGQQQQQKITPPCANSGVQTVIAGVHAPYVSIPGVDFQNYQSMNSGFNYKQVFQETICVKINNLLVPEIAKHGDPVVLDCDFSLEAVGDDELVVKWYKNKTLVYQWIPAMNKRPQDLGVLKGKLNLAYAASEDTQSIHRALHILAPGPDLSGDYTCSVSTLKNEDQKTKSMLVLVTEKNLMLRRKLITEDIMEVTCNAEGVYPKPSIVLISQEREVIEAKVNVRKKGELYDVTAVATLPSLQDPEVFSCELRIPEANYTKRQETVFFPGQDSKGHISFENHSDWLPLLTILYIYFSEW